MLKGVSYNYSKGRDQVLHDEKMPNSSTGLQWDYKIIWFNYKFDYQ